MKKKKSSKSNLESKRGLFFQMGLVITLALALIAFEWAEEVTTKNIYGNTLSIDEIPEYIVEIPRVIEKKVEPPKPILVELKLMEDTDDFNEEDITFTSDADEGDLTDWAPWDDGDEEPYTDDPFFIVENMPEFKNGDLSKFRDYIQQHVVYSEMAIGLELQGKVTIQFIVDETGKVNDVKIIRGVDPLLDDEVIRAVLGSPKWKPGKQRGIPVKVAMTMPVNFRLE